MNASCCQEPPLAERYSVAEKVLKAAYDIKNIERRNEVMQVGLIL